jgi:hypothetical protein
MTIEPNPIVSRAALLGGPGSIPDVRDGDIFKLPVFEADFISEAWPETNGHVVLRYPCFGDEVEIERLAVMRGGTLLARALATFNVCLESAPARWWRPNPDPTRPPVPAPDRLPCPPDLVDLWTRWLAWRDSFRSRAAGEGAPGPDKPADGPVDRG